MPRIAAGFVALVHTETGAESAVPESTVHLWERRGWRRADAAAEQFSNEWMTEWRESINQSSSSSAAPSDPIASTADETHGPEGADNDPPKEG